MSKKGFTVKAKLPERPSNENEFDISAAKEAIRGKTIVFCLPGRGVSYIFLKNFVQLCFDLVSNGAKIRSNNNNTSGQTYIYAAFAENPFKYANAR